MKLLLISISVVAFFAPPIDAPQQDDRLIRKPDVDNRIPVERFPPEIVRENFHNCVVVFEGDRVKVFEGEILGRVIGPPQKNGAEGSGTPDSTVTIYRWNAVFRLPHETCNGLRRIPDGN